MTDVRAKAKILPILGLSLLLVFPIANVTAAIFAPKAKTRAEIWEVERADIIDTRRSMIVELRTKVDHCEVTNAHELARLLAMDGRFDELGFFAQGYQAQCGTDPVVDHWGKAPRPRAR